MLPTPSSSSGRERTKSRASKSDKHRGLGIGQPSAPHTPVTSTSPSPAPGLTSPRTPSRGGMGRFLRRVASAPNAKGFFNLSKGHKGRDENGTAMSPGTRTPKGFGLLSPSASMTGRSSPVPEVPPVPSNVNGAASGQRGSDHGTDSLDTSSSGSSRNRNLYPNPHSYGPGSSPPSFFPSTRRCNPADPDSGSLAECTAPAFTATCERFLAVSAERHSLNSGFECCIWTSAIRSDEGQGEGI